MSEDRAQLFDSLRASTIALLGYDANQLTAAQGIRVDRAITLQLTIDDLQARQMRGEQIDVRAFTDASESLERMLGSNPDVAVVECFNPDHQRKLRALIEATVLGGPDAAERDARDEALLAVFHKIERGGNPDVLRAHVEQLIRETSMSEASSPPPAAVATEPAPSEPQPAPPLPTSNQPPLPRDGAIPPNYLRDSQQREAWYDPAAVGNVIPWVR